jgi:CRP/FNR family transcriptional regulator
MGLSVVSQLGQNCKDVYDNLRRLTFPANVTQRLARLVQEWYLRAKPGREGQECRFQVTLTQEEIAQMVGSTRETVSRILMDFRRKGWIRARGVTWVVTNPGALLRLAEAGERRR